MTARKIFFTPGPSALYFTVQDHLRKAFRMQIPSISHRSQQFSNIYRETEERLKHLVGLPDDYVVFFTASATEVWERMLQSCVRERSLHLVNGAFSRRCFEIANQLGLAAASVEAEMGQAVDPSALAGDWDPELVAVTHNETSTGAQQPLEDLMTLKKMYPNALIAVDVVSSFPAVELPFHSIDMAYFSVQKGMGLPAGLGVWMLNRRCVDRAHQLEDFPRGSYHSVLSFWDKYQKYQTPATPNVLAIYLLNRVLQDMLNHGIDRIRRETRYKAALLYQSIQDHPLMKTFVKEEKWQSQTVAVAEAGNHTESLIRWLDQKNMVVGSGYGPFKKQHLRVANFPTHSKEQVEMLVDHLKNFAGESPADLSAIRKGPV